VAGERRGGGASWGEAIVLARGIHESFAMLKRLGYWVYPQSKARINGCPTWVVAAMLWMMSHIRPFRELLATGKNECRALVDVMVTAAPQAKPPVRVPRIQAVKPA
jgi:2-dehydropantoate 2-reductase